MSHWTAVLITATVTEDTSLDITGDEKPEFPAMDYLNNWLAENYHASRLFHVTNPLPDGREGQRPDTVFAGHFKHLHIPSFQEAVKAAPWQWRETVQLFIRDEHDDVFTETKLAEGPK
jgi:hypothetical protein